MRLPTPLQQVDLEDFGIVDSLLKVLFVVVEEVKELFEKSLKSCFVFKFKGKTFKVWAVFDPFVEVDTFTIIEVLEVYIEEPEANKKAIIVEMNKFTIANTQPITIKAGTRELSIKELEVCR